MCSGRIPCWLRWCVWYHKTMKGKECGDMSDDVGYWIAVITGIVTCFVTLYGMWREWQAFRQNQTNRLSTAATVAVRRTDAAYVRPLLTGRMSDTINAFLPSHPGEDALRFRTLLFRNLVLSMQLTSRSGVVPPPVARRTKNASQSERPPTISFICCNPFACIPKGNGPSIPSPPIRVRSDAEIHRNMQKLEEQIETAYKSGCTARFVHSATACDPDGQSVPLPVGPRRSSLELIQQLSQFSGNVVASIA